MSRWRALDIRPYQLLCLICRAGGNRADGAGRARVAALARLLKREPQRPLTLRCNVASHYRYQNPGLADDTPEGALFNVKRDLDVLRRLGLAPGDTRPAWELLRRTRERIPTVAGLCGYGLADGPWRGCASAECGAYERGVAGGMAALLPARTEEDLAATKAETASVVLAADHLYLRPHHLLCMACFHGGRTTLAPIAEDNLYEAVAAIQRNPDIPVTLIEGCCMICPPCPSYDPATRLCVRNNAMGLRDEKKDLDLLQRLNLPYGVTLPARDLYTRIFAAIATTTEICGAGTGDTPGWEWTVCGGPTGNEAYRQARAAGLGIVPTHQEAP